VNPLLGWAVAETGGESGPVDRGARRARPIIGGTPAAPDPPPCLEGVVHNDNSLAAVRT